MGRKKQRWVPRVWRCTKCRVLLVQRRGEAAARFYQRAFETHGERHISERTGIPRQVLHSAPWLAFKTVSELSEWAGLAVDVSDTEAFQFAHYGGRDAR